MKTLLESPVVTFQTLLKLPVDGTWSPTDQAALLKASPTIKKRIQKVLRVEEDGVWGPMSQAALNAWCMTCSGLWIECEASSFADPADIVAFKRCKATGKSDVKCFEVGDNGVGQFGDITAQELKPFVAVHKDFMISKWGSVHAAAHRDVELCINGQMIIAKVGDRISARGRIDCNPAVLRLLKLKAPLKIAAKWRWL